MADRLKVGLIGVKNVNARGFATKDGEKAVPLDDVEFVAAADVNAESLGKLCEGLGIGGRYENYGEMIEKEELEAAVIALPTFLHKDATIACLEAGLHVICEKPPTNNYEEMLEVAEVARKSPGKYMFIRQSRFGANVQAARKMVADGKLGNVYCAEAKWIRSRGRQIRGNAWRSEKDRGGGVLLDLGIHGIDQAWFAMGRPKAVEVMAGTFTAFKQYAGEPEKYSADDTFAGMIRFETGAVMNCLFAFGMNAVGPARADEPYSKEWQISRLYGTEGGLDINKRQFIHGPVSEVEVEDVPTNGFSNDSPMVLQAREFIRAIRTDTTPLNSLDDALALMKMLSGLMESGDTGRSVRLD